MAAALAEVVSEVIKVVLADDHEVVRAGLRAMLERTPGFEVVAEAGDVETARRYVGGHRPDVLVLDMHMPGAPSVDAIGMLREKYPHTQIVVLTMEEDPVLARRALTLGAMVTSRLPHGRVVSGASKVVIDGGVTVRFQKV